MKEGWLGMGRYYDGDIIGRFWYSVQGSDDADYFGVTGFTLNTLYYYYEKEDLEGVVQGVNKCEDMLGEALDKLDDFFKDNFFKDNTGYNKEMLMAKFEWTEQETDNNLEWYARLQLGKEIRDSIRRTGQCHFEAEC